MGGSLSGGGRAVPLGLGSMKAGPAEDDEPPAAVTGKYLGLPARASGSDLSSNTFGCGGLLVGAVHLGAVPLGVHGLTS